MLDNPFRMSSGLATPLRLEVCQQIHAAALAAAISDRAEADEIPSSIDPVTLLARVRSLGLNAILLHPEIIEQYFAGVTLAVYLTIQRLYCSRIERSIHMIWTIINAMAQQAQASALSYEAIWAICVFLRKRRMRATRVSLEPMATTWWIILLPSEDDTTAEEAFPSLVCVFDETSRLVMAFRAVMPLSLPEAIALALYDTLLLYRTPSREAPAAIIWHVPERLVVDEVLPCALQPCCSRLGIRLERRCAPSFAQSLRQRWMQEVVTRHLRSQRWLSAFDSYLHMAIAPAVFKKSVTGTLLPWSDIQEILVGISLYCACCYPAIQQRSLPREPSSIEGTSIEMISYAIGLVFP